MTTKAVPFEAELIELRRWWRLNKRAETQRMRLNKQNESFVAFQFGYNTFIEDAAERKRLLKMTSDALDRFEKDEPLGLPGGADIDTTTASILRATKPAIIDLELAEKDTRKRMEKIAAKLPGADWIAATAGVSLYGYACVVAMLGDPRSYERENEDGSVTIVPTTPQGLRRYIGLAPKNSYERSDDGVAMQPGAKHAVIYAKVGDGLLGLTHPQNVNPYRAIMHAKLKEYMARQAPEGKPNLYANEANKTGASAYSIKMARRYAQSRWLTDLWRVWNGQEPRDLDLKAARAA